MRIALFPNVTPVLRLLARGFAAARAALARELLDLLETGRFRRQPVYARSA